MIIVADENIPHVREAFAHLGEVRAVSGRAITRELLREAECLLVRSVTKVNRALLEETRVRFVATATSGFDHVDRSYLESAGIGFAYAPGSNAISVAEWVVAAILYYAMHSRVTLAGKSIGVIGVGHVGSEVVRRMEALGLRVVLNDPPLFDRTGEERYRPLAEALACDFVTLHTPLTRDEPHPTYHLANEAFFDAMKTGAVFINASRGAVADTAALKNSLALGHLGMAMLDVWEGEPNIDVDLLKVALLATPHIAGYSFDGKIKGARMIYERTCDHFGIAPDFDWNSVLPSPLQPVIRCDGDCANLEVCLSEVICRVYDIEGDDARFRKTLDVPSKDRGGYFTRLRKEYPVRREFALHEVTGGGLTADSIDIFRKLGFRG